MVSSLFPPRILQEDGNINSYNKTNYMMAGAFTTNYSTADAIYALNMYDGLSTTYMGGGAGSGTSYYVKWNFGTRKKFKTIYAKIAGRDGGGTHFYIRLQGSNDDTNWTTIQSSAQITSSTDQHYMLLATLETYRYIRVLKDGGSNGTLTIYNMVGVV